MNRFAKGALIFSLITLFSFGVLANSTYADEEEANTSTGTSISLEPSSRTMQISSDSVYESSFKFKNDGENELTIEAYAAPYAYVYSEDDDLYKLGFNHENNFTQIARWITIMDDSGNYVERPRLTVPGHGTIDINYRVTTPSNIPAGGQYAVIFAQTVSNTTTASGIRTEASAGMIIYGHSSEGEVTIGAEISGLEIKQGGKDSEGNNRSGYYASAKVKNTGNVDFNAVGKLKVEPIIGSATYETSNGNGIVVSVIPESERIVEDEWKDTPGFGVYKLTWTVTAGEETETIDRVVFIFSPIILLITIILLTILVVWIIIGIRRRKELRARLAV